MLRLCRVFLVVAAIAAVTAPSAAAVPDRKLSGLLGDMWTTILETPAADNPFTGGDPCIQLGANIVAPFGPSRNSRASSSQGRKFSWPPTAPSAARSRIHRSTGTTRTSCATARGRMSLSSNR